MSIFHEAEEVVKVVLHHIPKDVKDRLKGVIEEIGPAAWHLLIKEAAPIAAPVTGVLEVLYDQIPDGPEKEEAEAAMKQVLALYWHAIIDRHTEPEPAEE